jgi:hypothetical protein
MIHEKIIRNAYNTNINQKEGICMSDREKVYQLLDTVPDYKIGYVVAYLQGITDGEEAKPNQETVEAIEELQNGGGEVYEGSAHDFLQMMLED